ncbi:MAG: efflux RND transporter periplasmic adaptor subunit [Alphaproteobacteria bacterium]
MRKSYILAVLIAIGAAAWVLSGQIGATSPEPAVAADNATAAADAPAEAKAETATTVRVLHSVARERMEHVLVRGRTEAKRRVHLKSEVPGTIVELPKTKGERVKRGDVIARLAVEERQARLAESRALVKQRELEYQAAKKLTQKGYRSETSFAGTAAQLDAAKAAVKAMEVQLGKTVIRAPFDAVIDDRMVERGDFVKDGAAIALLIDEDPFLIVGQVSEIEVGRLRLGDHGTAKLVTGETVTGAIRFVATAADPATRTFRVELEVPNPDKTLRDGITAEIAFPTSPVPAHFISPALLTLNDAGVVGVRTVGPADAKGMRTVAFHPVNLLDDETDGVWITGLPPEIDIISVGQEFVREGEKVMVAKPGAA